MPIFTNKIHNKCKFEINRSDSSNNGTPTKNPMTQSMAKLSLLKFKPRVPKFQNYEHHPTIYLLTNNNPTGPSNKLPQSLQYKNISKYANSLIQKVQLKNQPKLYQLQIPYLQHPIFNPQTMKHHLLLQQNPKPKIIHQQNVCLMYINANLRIQNHSMLLVQPENPQRHQYYIYQL